MFQHERKKMLHHIRTRIPSSITKRDIQMLNRLFSKYQSHPSILVNKVRCDFARSASWIKERHWAQLRLSDFYIDTVVDHLTSGYPKVKIIKMVPKEKLSPDVSGCFLQRAVESFAIRETGSEICPVASFEYYLSRIRPVRRGDPETKLILDDQTITNLKANWTTVQYWFDTAMSKNRREDIFSVFKVLIGEYIQDNFTFDENYTSAVIGCDWSVDDGNNRQASPVQSVVIRVQ